MLTLGWNYRRLEAHEDQLLGTEALHNDAWLVGAESSPSIHTGRTAAVRRTAGFSGVGLELGTEEMHIYPSWRPPSGEKATERAESLWALSWSP